MEARDAATINVRAANKWNDLEPISRTYIGPTAENIFDPENRSGDPSACD
jgi:hypothetical protein